MTLSPLAEVLLIMNNYFHDVATAFLLTAAVMMLVMYRAAERGGSAELAALARMRPKLTRVAVAAILWIVIGGIPRTVFYNKLEYPVAEYKGLLLALGVKHMLMFALVVAGVILWARARKLLTHVDATQALESKAPAA